MRAGPSEVRPSLAVAPPLAADAASSRGWERNWRQTQPLLDGPLVGLPWRPWVLLALFIVCLIPRAWTAWTQQILWGDTVLYFRSSEALLHGDFSAAFSEFGLNVYTLILAGFQRLGLDWQTWGQWWSVLAATLVVLPLWGLVRRMFDDRVAVLACLCYAFHGKLMAIAPLIIRDSTFWLLFTMALYAIWRAVTEGRTRWFFASGLAIMLAIFTRTEGLLLLVPLVGWCAGRLWSMPQGKWRFMIGPAIGLAVLPATLVLVNVIWLRDNPQWNLLRTAHVRIAWEWWHSQPLDAQPAVGPHLASRARADMEDLPLGVEPSSRNWSALTYDRKMATRLMRAYTYSAGLLTIVGLTIYWRCLLRRDHFVLLLMNTILLAMIRVRYARAGLDIRYFMPMIIVAMPWIGLGFVRICDWVQKFFSWLPGLKRVPRYALVGVLAAGFATASLSDSRLAGARLMQRQSAVGDWIRQRLGPGQSIGGYFIGLDLASFCAKGQIAGVLDPRQHGVDGALAQVPALHADVLLFELDDESGPLAQDLATRIEQAHGYRTVPAAQMPPKCEQVRILLRPGKSL